MERTPLILMGANNPETLRLIHDINSAGTAAFDILGWVDNNPDKHGTEVLGLPVLGAPEILNDEQYCGCMVFNNITTSGEVRRETTRQLAALGVAFATLTHPSVNLDGVRIGQGCCVQEGALVQAGAVLKDHAFVAPGAIICHETVLERYVFVSSGATISGLTRIGEAATIWAGASVAPRLNVGRCAQVGIGSAVIFDVAPHVTVLGIPARELHAGRHS